MTDSMIERVARGIAAARGFNFIGRETSIDDLRRTFGPSIFREARAAIDALREPTEAMALAGFDQLDMEASPHAAEACWSAMIDAALS